MERACGTVVELIAERARVTTRPAPACGGCASREACDPWGGGRGERIVEAVNRAGARPGDRVVLDVAPAGVLGSALLLYLLPAVAAVSGAALGAAWGPKWFGIGADAGAGLFLVAALVPALLLVRRLSPVLAKRSTFQVSIVEILPGGAESVSGNPGPSRRAETRAVQGAAPTEYPGYFEGPQRRTATRSGASGDGRDCCSRSEAGSREEAAGDR